MDRISPEFRRKASNAHTDEQKLNEYNTIVTEFLFLSCLISSHKLCSALPSKPGCPGPSHEVSACPAAFARAQSSREAAAADSRSSSAARRLVGDGDGEGEGEAEEEAAASLAKREIDLETTAAATATALPLLLLGSGRTRHEEPAT